jgi:hypothetical protein
MSKYTPLWEHVQKDGRTTFKLTFAEIQEAGGIAIGDPRKTAPEKLKIIIRHPVVKRAV